MSFNLMILTEDPDFAEKAENAGIDRIFYDLEYINKRERQAGRNTVISNNTPEGIPRVKAVLNRSKLLVRINPIHQYTENEVEQAIAYGADIIMLPMVFDDKDAKSLVDFVAGRSKVCVMIETAQALSRIDSILDVVGIDELFFGLNDLHISLGLDFMFETLSGGLVEYMANKCKVKGMPFGFGGIARIGEGVLPAEKILAEHLRLGSTSVILSRTFKGDICTNENSGQLLEQVCKVRNSIKHIKDWSNTEFSSNCVEIKNIVAKLINQHD
jgi:hypothetical protein